MIKIKSPTQPIENAEVFDIYNDSEKRSICIIANDGFELVKEGEEPNNISRVDIPAMYEERVTLYSAIPWVEITKEPEIDVEPETPNVSEETQATEEDYINALEELGVNFNE